MDLAILILFGIICGVIADQKGYNFVVWFVVGIFLNVLALIFLLLRENIKEADSIECPHCAEIIKRKAKICRYCKEKVKNY